MKRRTKPGPSGKTFQLRWEKVTALATDLARSNALAETATALAVVADQARKRYNDTFYDALRECGIPASENLQWGIDLETGIISRIPEEPEEPAQVPIGIHLVEEEANAT